MHQTFNPFKYRDYFTRQNIPFEELHMLKRVTDTPDGWDKISHIWKAIEYSIHYKEEDGPLEFSDDTLGSLMDLQRLYLDPENYWKDLQDSNEKIWVWLKLKTSDWDHFEVTALRPFYPMGEYPANPFLNPNDSFLATTGDLEDIFDDLLTWAKQAG